MWKIVLRIILFLSFIMLSKHAPVIAATGSREVSFVDYSAIIETEANWIASLQQPSGAIVMSRDKTYIWDGKECYKIEPYFANLAVIAMLENPTSENIDVAKKWIEWYMNHLNSPDYNGIYGSVYAYYIDKLDNAEYSAGTYDSTDSYAATFMMLLKKYYEITGDDTFLITNRREIEQIANVMIATQDNDGLTYAKPDYEVKFLMDNTEVYEGLSSIEYLESTVFNDLEKAEYYRNKKELNFNGVEKYLWSNLDNNYKKDANSITDWATFYPDATSQLFPIWTDVISLESLRAKDLYFKFNSHHYGWPYLSTSDSFPWALIAYTAAVLNDKDRVDTFLSNVFTEYLTTGHEWPWYNMEAGETILAAKTMRDKYNIALNKAVTASSNITNVSSINDGRLTTEWISTPTNNEWIVIDLGENMQFNRILLKWGTDYADQYVVQVSNDGINFQNIYSEIVGNGETDDIIADPWCGRYIKIIFTHRATTEGVSLREVEVYYNAPNLALNKSVTASSNAEYAYLSVDGNTSTRWGSAYADNQWYKIDLGSITSINMIVIDWEAAYDKEYSIQISTDDINYITVYLTTDSRGGIDTITFPTINARYVKLLLTTRATPYGSSFWEVRVYNDTNNYFDKPINYALNKTATASSVQSGSTFTPDKAVDGNLSTRWSSIYENNQWFKVNLEDTNTIRRIIIRWETAYDSEYSIQVSIDDINYKTVYYTTTGEGGIDEIPLIPNDSMYIKILCIKRATSYGSSFWEFEVYNK